MKKGVLLLGGSLLAASSSVLAVGLGPVLNVPVIGEPLKVRIQLLGDTAQRLDPACFRLQMPASADMPVLKSAKFALVGGAGSGVLEVSHWEPLQTPLIKMTLRVDCGSDVARDYVLMAAPPPELAKGQLAIAPDNPLVQASTATVERVEKPKRSRPTGARASSAPRAAKPVNESVAPSVPAAQPVVPASAPISGDQVQVSREAAPGEPALGLASGLSKVPATARPNDNQLAILRLEYKVLQAMHEQAGSQLDTSDKLRNLELALTELQKRNVSQAETQNQALNTPPAPPVAAVPAAMPTPDDEGMPLWMMLAAALGGAGLWLGWKRYSQKGGVAAVAEHSVLELPVDPRRSDERDEPEEPEPVAPLRVTKAAPAPVEVPPPPGTAAPLMVDFPVGEMAPPEQPGDSALSISGATVDEHFEANPVMELADIMLSFGRVKGAAQALQEFIDQNPQEALQPWIRLMEIYRLAGMRDEFERVSENLNKNFNVEVQQWDAKMPAAPAASLDIDLGAPFLSEERSSILSKALTIEDMPRVCEQVVTWWSQPDAARQIHQLLRDNGGGTRQGFSLPVVEELLFLIDLRQAIDRAA